MTNEEIALGELIEARISQAENRLLKWCMALLLSFVVSAAMAFVAFGALQNAVANVATRVTTLETYGAAPIRASIAALQERVAANGDILREIRTNQIRTK